MNPALTPIQPIQPLASAILFDAVTTLDNRATDRDVQQERTMGDIVKTFNTFSGHSLTETEGWAFMVILKMVRSARGKPREDDYTDMAGYVALMGECALGALPAAV